MKLKFITFFVMLTLIFFPTYSNAKLTSNNIYDMCKINNPGTLYYILGMMHQTEVYNAATNNNMKKIPYSYCVPDDIQYGNIENIVCKTILSVPQDKLTNIPAPLLVQYVLHEFFPCGNN